MIWVGDSQYLSQWKYVEVARFVPKLDRIIREQFNKQSIFMEWPEVCEYSQRNNETGIFTSVWQYNSVDLERATRLANLYFDLDGENALEEVKRLQSYFGFIYPEAIQIYFTGSKGFHLEIQAIPLGITPSNDLPDTFRLIATSLKESLRLSTLDLSVYDARRMWRVPNTRHQKTNLYKIPLTSEQLHLPLDDIKQLAQYPIKHMVSNQEFCEKANAWYREWIYKKAIKKQAPFERFEKHGTNLVKKTDDNILFTPDLLFKHCPSMLRLWEKAEKEHHLEHEERLVCLSLLSYDNEALGYLYTMLEECNDFNRSKSQSHIDDWIRRRDLGIGGRPFTCKKMNEIGIGCGDCEQRLKPNPQYERVGNNLVATGTEAEVSPIRFAYARRISQISKIPVTIDYRALKF